MDASHGRTLSNRLKVSGFMKNVSEKSSSFRCFFDETDLFLFKFAIFEFFSVRNLLPTYLLTF